MFCFDKKEMEEIMVKWGNIGLPSICLIISKNEKNCLLAYLAADDYHPFFFKETPVEDILFVDDEEEQYLRDTLKPKVLQILTNYAIIELKGKKHKIPRYEHLNELNAK